MTTKTTKDQNNHRLWFTADTIGSCCGTRVFYDFLWHDYSRSDKWDRYKHEYKEDPKEGSLDFVKFWNEVRGELFSGFSEWEKEGFLVTINLIEDQFPSFHKELVRKRWKKTTWKNRNTGNILCSYSKVLYQTQADAKKALNYDYDDDNW